MQMNKDIKKNKKYVEEENNQSMMKMMRSQEREGERNFII